MYLNKITLALFVIYTIINVLYVIDLNTRLETTELNLHVVKKQSTATTMLLLAHVDLHDVQEKTRELKEHRDLYQIYPQIKYD